MQPKAHLCVRRRSTLWGCGISSLFQDQSIPGDQAVLSPIPGLLSLPSEEELWFDNVSAAASQCSFLHTWTFIHHFPPFLLWCFEVRVILLSGELRNGPGVGSWINSCSDVLLLPGLPVWSFPIAICWFPRLSQRHRVCIPPWQDPFMSTFNLTVNVFINWGYRDFTNWINFSKIIAPKVTSLGIIFQSPPSRVGNP